VYGGHGALRPAHQDQVEVSVSCQQMAGQHSVWDEKKREKKLNFFKDKMTEIRHKTKKS
jgi:catabolite regulation protein CreA